MRRKINVFLIVLITLMMMSGTAMAWTCSRCGKTGTETYRQINATQHFKDNDCVDVGCGYAETVRENHSFGSWKSDGAWKTHTKTCGDCGYSVTEDHDYDKKYYTASNAENCYYYKCSICPSTTSSESHSWDSGSITTSPTCTKTGVKTYTCTNYSTHKKTETVDALDHSHTGSCTTCGTPNVVCTRCGDTIAHDCHVHDYSYQPATCTTPATCICGATSGIALDHDWVESSRVAATCTATGAINYTCSRCSKTKSETIPKIEHSYGTVYTASGSSGCYNKCTACGLSNSVTAHVSDGTNSGYTTTQHYQVCTRCSYKFNYADHDLTTTTTKTPTCTVSGTSVTSCSDCNYSVTNTISAPGHSYGVYQANGSSGHRRQCSVCSTYDNTVPHTMSTSLVLCLNDETKHCYRCSVCLYESDIAAHNYTVKSYKYDSASGKYVHTRWCNTCKLYELSPEECSFTSRITTETSCTAPGNRRHTCSVCGQYYNEEIPIIEHIWSEWQTSRTEHWYTCEYGCGTENSRGTHVDTSPKDGYCDICNYLMYVTPVINISSDVVVKENETATFSVNLVEGTAPITYQWYYKTSSSGTANAISGANGTTLSFTATKEMNGRYYYCTATNLGGTGTSTDAHLTVYYTFTIGEHPQDKNVKKGETATFSVSIGEHGNPNSYTYQWYVANSLTGNGSRLAGATSDTYSVTPTKNIAAEYYYCIISNGKYEVASNRAKLTADIMSPTITVGTVESNKKINSSAMIKIPFTVTDTGEGYEENQGNTTNFTEEDIIIKVDNVVNNSAIKDLTYTSSSGNNHYYELTVTGITGDGELSIEVPINSVQDKFGNANESPVKKSTFTMKDEKGEVSTGNITVDNTAPVINFEKVVSGINGKYANSEDTIIIEVSIFEEGGMDPEEFKKDDIIVKVAGTDANADLSKKVEYNESEDKYIITLSGIKGEGELTIDIPEKKVYDYAKNFNTSASPLVITNNAGENVIIDNTKPEIDSLLTKLDSYDSSIVYPDNINPRHQNWSNKDIYVSIEASDNGEIESYMKSEGNNTNYKEITAKHMIDKPINAIIYYRVVDMAGNYSEISKEIKLDKTKPKEPEISLFDERVNGAIYVYSATRPTSKSVYVIPNASSIVDDGTVKSGIETDIAYTYYTKTMYTDPSKQEQIGTTKTYKYDEGMLLTESGYYEFVMTVTDIAGNTITNTEPFKVYIAKKAENTIRITNINDIGSGVEKVTIEIFKGDTSGNKTTEDAIEPIIIYNPYKEIIQNVTLGDGTFYVNVTLEDKVGNIYEIKDRKITNKL